MFLVACETQPAGGSCGVDDITRSRRVGDSNREVPTNSTYKRPYVDAETVGKRSIPRFAATTRRASNYLSARVTPRATALHSKAALQSLSPDRSSPLLGHGRMSRLMSCISSSLLALNLETCPNVEPIPGSSRPRDTDREWHRRRAHSRPVISATKCWHHGGAASRKCAVTANGRNMAIPASQA